MKHLTNYTCPKRQRRCIFILLLVPIYALTAAIGCSVALLLVLICAIVLTAAGDKTPLHAMASCPPSPAYSYLLSPWHAALTAVPPSPSPADTSVWGLSVDGHLHLSLPVYLGIILERAPGTRCTVVGEGRGVAGAQAGIHVAWSRRGP